MPEPAVSILIPVYNTEHYIGQAIQSILDQTFQYWELIIVNDCSTDNTLEVCQGYALQDSRIKVFNNDRNLGMMPNWNKGLEYCHAKYFAKLDADDWWDKNMLEACYTVIEADSSLGLVFSKHRLVNESGQIISDDYDLVEFARQTSFSGLDLVLKGTNGMLAENVMKQGIGLMRRSVFDELGVFSLHDAGDTEMWFRIASRYRVYGINQFYHFHRVWPQNFTRTKVLEMGKQERNLFEVREIILKYYFKEGLVIDSFYHQQANINQFEYNKFLIYKYRVQRNFGKLISTFFMNLKLDPGQTIKYYLSRVKLS